MIHELKTRILNNTEQLHAIANEWIALLQRCPAATPFQRPEWVISWAEIFSPECIRVVEVRVGNMLIGLAPLLIYSRGQERVLAFMAGGISDYLDLLVDPQYENEVMAAILQAIEGLECWTTLDLTDLPANSALHRSTLAQFAIPHDRCSSLFVPSSRDTLLQYFSKRQRANLRQARSRIQKAGGCLETSTQQNANECLQDLFRLHTKRWLRDGQPGVLDEEKVVLFHRNVVPSLHATGVLRFHRLRIGGETVAVMYTLHTRSTVFCYLQGYDPAFAALSPGTYLMFWVMEQAIMSGVTKFELLRGEEAYKQHWRAECEVTLRIRSCRTFEGICDRLESAAA